mgnify:CR=1 FL=1
MLFIGGSAVKVRRSFLGLMEMVFIVYVCYAVVKYRADHFCFFAGVLILVVYGFCYMLDMG